MNGVIGQSWQYPVANKVDVKKHTGDIIFSGAANKQYCYLNYTSLESMWGGCYLMCASDLFLVQLNGPNTPQIIRIGGFEAVSTPALSIDTENNRIIIKASSQWMHFGVAVIGQAASSTTITFA